MHTRRVHARWWLQTGCRSQSQLVPTLQDVVDEGGFAGAQKPSNHCDWNLLFVFLSHPAC